MILPTRDSRSSKKREKTICAICFEKISKKPTHMIYNKLYNKLSQKTITNRLHLGKPAYSKYKKFIILPCKHNFHQKCIKKWFQQSPTCPLCRK